MRSFISGLVFLLFAAFFFAIDFWDLFSGYIARLRGRGEMGQFVANLLTSPGFFSILFLAAVFLIIHGIRENMRLRDLVPPEGASKSRARTKRLSPNVVPNVSKPMANVAAVECVVTDANTGRPSKGAKIVAYDNSYGHWYKARTNRDGVAILNVHYGSYYKLTTSAWWYKTRTEAASFQEAHVVLRITLA